MKRFRSAYETLADSRPYQSVDFKLKVITWTVATISAISTAYANGLSHWDRLKGWAILLGIGTFLIVEFSLYALEQGLRETFKGGTQRSLAWFGKWAIKLTMIANACYLCCVIAGVTIPESLLFWNRWSFAVHFAIGLILIPLIRDSDPVTAARMLQLRAETAQEDQILARLSVALASPVALFGARFRGFCDGVVLGFRLAFNRQGFSPKNYVTNLNSFHKVHYGHVEGRQHKETEYESPDKLSLPPAKVPALQSGHQNIGFAPKVAKVGSGTGLNLPDMPNVRFESNSKGGIETWFSPPGAVRRSDRTYLGHIGKKELTRLSSDPNGKEVLRRMVEDQMRQKGITLSLRQSNS